MKETLQHKETIQCIGVSTASSRSHNSYGTEAHYALTFKLDQLDEADQSFPGCVESAFQGLTPLEITVLGRSHHRIVIDMHDAKPLAITERPFVIIKQ